MANKYNGFLAIWLKQEEKSAEKIKLIDIVVELVDARAPLSSSKNPMFNEVLLIISQD